MVIYFVFQKQEDYEPLLQEQEAVSLIQIQNDLQFEDEYFSYSIQNSGINSFFLKENKFQNMRKIISFYVLQKVRELELDVKDAQSILDEMRDEDFQQDLLNKITSDTILNLLNNINLDKTQNNEVQKQQEISIQIRNVLQDDRINLKQEEYKEQALEVISCPICYCDITQNNNFTDFDCHHYFCLKCVNFYLQNKINSSDVFNIVCPNDQCNKKISDEQIQNIIDAPLFTKMKTFRKMKILSKDENIRFCTRAGCELYVSRQKNEPVLICECGQKICFQCGNSTHRGTCDNAIDKTFRQAIKQYQIQKCPKCKSPIQKSSGCNHMTCQHCEYQFCWLCRAKYDNRHYKKWNIFGCPGQMIIFSDISPYKYPLLRKLIILILFIIFALPGMALAIIFLPIIIMQLSCDQFSNFKDEECCYQCIMVPLWIVICIAISPLSLVLIVLAIILSPFFFIGIICMQCY